MFFFNFSFLSFFLSLAIFSSISFIFLKKKSSYFYWSFLLFYVPHFIYFCSDVYYSFLLKTLDLQCSLFSIFLKYKLGYIFVIFYVITYAFGRAFDYWIQFIYIWNDYSYVRSNYNILLTAYSLFCISLFLFLSVPAYLFNLVIFHRVLLYCPFIFLKFTLDFSLWLPYSLH